MIKCIIFDCDGTLVDSEYLGHLAMEIQLQKSGIKESALEMMAKHRGGKLDEIVCSLEEKHNVVLGDNFIASYRICVEKLFKRELKEIEGVTALLNNIELPICIATGGPMAKISQSLSITNLKRFFGDNIFSSYEVNSWKPAPDLFLHAANAMGVKPAECLVVDDSPIGIEAALRAKMKAVFYNPSSLDIPHSNVVTITKMQELLSTLIPR